jgi:acetylornithine deacetylase
MTESAIKLAYDLCRISSISGDESHALSFLTSWLKSAGFVVEMIFVDRERFNIFAYSQARQHYSVIYCSHIDTVAPFIEPSLDQEILYGRGACDAKGILASMIMAVVKQRSLGFLDLGLLITVGEEEKSDGAKVCNDLLKGRSSYLVVGEPTDLKAAHAQKGAIVFDLIACGREAHSARPKLGRSAIHALVHDINELLGFLWPKDEYYGETLLNFGEISGGRMRNVVASDAIAKGIMRTPIKSDTMIGMMKEKLSEGVNLDVKSATDPFSYFVPQGFISFLAEFGSDAPYLRDIGKPILIGPGSLDVAHRPDEHISFLEIAEGIAAYQSIAAFCRA